VTRLKRAGVVVVLALIAGGMWRALDWARPTWQAIDRRLHPPTAEAAVAPSPGNVTVELDVAPPGATLELDGEPLDRLRFQLFRSNDRHTIRASKEGFLPAAVDIIADDSKTVVIRLMRAPRRRGHGDEGGARAPARKVRGGTGGY